jgi:hypothetical protein
MKIVLPSHSYIIYKNKTYKLLNAIEVEIVPKSTKQPFTSKIISFFRNIFSW